MDSPSGARQPLPSRLVQTPWLLLAVTVTVWGANVVVARASTTEVSPFALVTLRWLIVCLLIAAYERGAVLTALRQLRPHWLYVIPMGAAGFTGSNGLLFAGARYTTGLNIAIVTAVIPVLVILGVRVVYGSRIGGRRMVGVVMTIVGILVVATQGDLTAVGQLRFNFGDLVEFGGALFYAGYTVALRRKPPIPAMAFFIGIALSAFAVSLPALGAEIAMGAVIWPTAGGWAAILYVAIFTSIIGQLSWIKAIERIGPSRAGVFQNLVPIIGASLSVLLLGESFHWYHGLSLALVLCGIYVSERMGK